MLLDKPVVEPVPRADSSTLRVLAFVFAALALALLFDFWPWFLLAMWTASLTHPVAAALQRRTGGRSRAAAFITIGLLMALLVPVGAAVAVVVPDAIDLVERAKNADLGSKTLVELVSTQNPNEGDTTSEDKKGAAEDKKGAAADSEAAPADSGVAPPAEPAPSESSAAKPADLMNKKPSQIVDMVKEHGKQAMTIGGVVAAALGSFALGLLMYFVGTYAALVHGGAAYLWLRERLPLSGESTDRLRDTYRETGRGLLYSVGLTALLQGGLATVAYVALGVPRAFALGLVTIIMSLIPSIGPFLVWGPVAAGLYFAGHPIKAGILVAVGVIVVAPADNFLRPLLARRGKLKLHEFVVFFSMVGAMSLIGGWGLIVGPLVFRMAREVMDMLREHRPAIYAGR